MKQPRPSSSPDFHFLCRGATSIAMPVPVQLSSMKSSTRCVYCCTQPVLSLSTFITCKHVKRLTPSSRSRSSNQAACTNVKVVCHTAKLEGCPVSRWHVMETSKRRRQSTFFWKHALSKHYSKVYPAARKWGSRDQRVISTREREDLRAGGHAVTA